MFVIFIHFSSVSSIIHDLKSKNEINKLQKSISHMKKQCSKRNKRKKNHIKRDK